MDEPPRALNSARYRIKRTLGGGAFGVVKLAYDSLLEQDVAIKIPHNEEMAEGLRLELQTMARIRLVGEPHLVQLYEPAEIEGRLAIVMEFVDGGSLRTRLGKIGQQKPIPRSSALALILQVCEALSAVRHRLQLVHRDIKPENILIRSGEDFVKIGDFGIARIFDGTGGTSSVAGTLPYMAPETLEGRTQHFGVDIYALGVVLYESLTGRLPFNPYDEEGNSKPQRKYIAEICDCRPRSPHEIAPQVVDEALARAVLRAMAPEPRDRYESTEELAAALRDASRSHDVDTALAQALKGPTPPDVERDLRRVSSSHPHDARPHLALARHMERQMRHAEALGVLDNGLRYCSASAELWREKALAADRLGRRGEALAAMERALEIGLAEKDAAMARKMADIWRGKAR